MNDEGYKKGSATEPVGEVIAPGHGEQAIQIGDYMQSESSRLAEWVGGREWDELPYEVGQALLGVESAVRQWTAFRAMAEAPARQADTPSSEAPPESRELERLRAIEKAAREMVDSFDPAWMPGWMEDLRSALDAGDGQ